MIKSHLTSFSFLTLIASLAIVLCFLLPDRFQIAPVAYAANITVNSTADHDDGVCNAADCTLREAINAAGAGDTISFNISGPGVHTINATAGFTIGKAVIIDGTTQTGYAGVPLIEINGAGTGGGANGFTVNSQNVALKGLVINGFAAYAISFDSSGNDNVQGCYIGTNATGTSASANDLGGIRINAPNVTIGGTSSGAGNLISGNKGNGIDVLVGNAIIQGNFIGVNAAGATRIGNSSGVVINGVGNNIIGGPVVGARNVISGNGQAGIRIMNAGASNNLIQGNFLGVDATGTVKYVCGGIGCDNLIGNANGVEVMTGAQNTTIGGTDSAARNVISGNLNTGVLVSGGAGMVIAGNFIGLDADGATPHGNHSNGIKITGGSAAIIGGPEPGARNVISGNNVILPGRVRPEELTLGSGVLISGGSGSQVLGNFIGTNADGNVAAPTVIDDVQTGVSIVGSPNNIIGGTNAASRNVISGNDFGVSVGGSGAINNLVQGNYIGVDVSGTHSLGNGIHGVEVYDGASNNTIGGTVTGAGNIIAFNGYAYRFNLGVGVFVQSGTGNAVLGNSIYSNNGLGIDLAPLNAVNPNDSSDADVGANNLQNSPVITSAINNSNTTTIQGTLDSAANTQFRIEFFANTECDPSSNGEGRSFLGFTNTQTGTSTLANFSFSIPNAMVDGPIITATATDANNNTSEFSPCVTPSGVLPTIQFSAPAYTVGEGDKRIDIPIIRTGDTSSSASINFNTNFLNVRQNCNLINGVAVSGCDYEPQQATVKFDPGDTSKTISIVILDDSYAEGPETFDVRLTNASGASVGAPSEAAITIIDDDLTNGPNPIDLPGYFVRQHYLDFLNREPDQSGLDYWTSQITACGMDQACIQQKRVDVSSAFFQSIEFQQIGYFVIRVYDTAFGATSHYFNSPTGQLSVSSPTVRMNEFLNDVRQLGAGVIVGQSGWETVLEHNKNAYLLDFVQRPRFLSQHPTSNVPYRYVDDLFLLAVAGVGPFYPDRVAAIDTFGNAADTSDMAARAQALRIVVDSPIVVSSKFNQAYLLMQYIGYLRRNPDDYPDSDYSGYYFWSKKIFNLGVDKAEMVKAFITSTEYRSRFGPSQ